jgi:SWI/SNF-related matrix-associated actin-dependent regulator 1 of chromatin subfamily A
VIPPPFEFQRATTEFCRGRRRSIIASQPGLGKTRSAIEAADLPALVLAPASLLVNWRREVELWRPGASPWFRVVSYADRELDRIKARDFGTVIADEAHFLKNAEATRTKLSCGLLAGARRAIAVSGTLIPNRPIELWPLAYSLRITERSFADFAMRYAAAFHDDWGALDVRGASNLPELRDLLSPHVIRFTKREVMPELPDKTWRVIALDLPAPRREKTFSADDLRYMDEAVAFEAMSAVLKEHGVRKIPLAVEHVNNVLEGAEKVVVFAYHRDVVLGIAAALEPHGVEVILGGQSPRRRQEAVDRFQKPDGPRVFVLQIVAGGVGYNLTAAHHVVFAEGSWVPAVLEQGADRCHRIGSRGNVTADVLTIHRSIDEHMIRRALDKLRVIDRIMPGAPILGTEKKALRSAFRVLG